MSKTMTNLVVFSAIVFSITNGLPTRQTLRIIGGNDADIAKHPWQVSIHSTGDEICSGALIAPQWVMTAAHCADSGTIINIRAGSNSSTSGGVEVSTDKIIIYPVGNGRLFDNDIALLRLQNPIIGANIQPILLPGAKYTVKGGISVNVAGWGKMDPVEELYPENLQDVSLPIVEQTLCKNIYNSMILTRNVTDNMFCAGYLGQGGKAPCYGDSGAPAVYNNEVIGIVSWGFKCATPRYPTVFLKVSPYVEWIVETIKAN